MFTSFFVVSEKNALSLLDFKNWIEELIFWDDVLFLLTGCYETVLRLHSPSLWTQMDGVKLVIMKRSNMFIYSIAVHKMTQLK